MTNQRKIPADDVVEDIMESAKKLGLTDKDWEEIEKERDESDR